jgi:hypothetical protein
VLSGLSLKLYTAERSAGALNLFGYQPGTWDVEAETIGTVLAAHAPRRSSPVRRNANCKPPS